MSKPILFVDFDNTLSYDVLWKSLPDEKLEVVKKHLFENPDLFHAWMRGEHTAEDITKILAKLLEMPYEELWELFVKDSKTVHVPDKALEKIERLRDRYVTILITTNTDGFSRFTVPALGLGGYFDEINNSYYERQFKDDNGGELFKKYLEKYDAPVAECVLVDDSKKPCETFEGLGGRVCRVTPEHDAVSFLTELESGSSQD